MGQYSIVVVEGAVMDIDHDLTESDANLIVARCVAVA